MVWRLEVLLHTMSQGTDLELGTTEFCSFFWWNMINNINNKSIIRHNLEETVGWGHCTELTNVVCFYFNPLGWPGWGWHGTGRCRRETGMCNESRVTGDLENTILTIVSTPPPSASSALELKDGSEPCSVRKCCFFSSKSWLFR